MGTKLLLADDSITIQKVVGIIFAGDEYQLTIVSNGDAALAKARETKPDVLLVDAVMPGRTGFEVCEEIRRDPLLKGVPILLLTGAFEPFDEGKARQSGADDFISKPFESQHLIDKVTTLAELGKRRAAATAASGPAVAPPIQPPPVIAKPVPAPPSQPAPVAVPFPTPPAAGAGSAVAAPADAAQFTVEIVDGTPDDDLWGAFELEEVAEEAADFGEISFEEEASFAAEAIEEPFTFAEEPEPLAQPAEFAPQWGPVEEETFDFEEEAGAGAFEAVPEEEFAVFAEEDGTAAFVAVPAPQFGGFEEEDIFAELARPVSAQPAEFFTEAAEPPLAESSRFQEYAAPAGEEFDLQFAPEEEYVPVSEAAPVAVPPVAAVQPAAVQSAAAGVPSLSEDQLAVLVSRISRDILEKIAWEVVPDLAERIIREEIRKIREG